MNREMLMLLRTLFRFSFYCGLILLVCSIFMGGLHVLYSTIDTSEFPAHMASAHENWTIIVGKMKVFGFIAAVISLGLSASIYFTLRRYAQ